MARGTKLLPPMTFISIIEYSYSVTEWIVVLYPWFKEGWVWKTW